MDSDSEVERILRPPSSYGSMRSDEEEEEEEDFERDSPITSNEPTGLQLIRHHYPETVHTQATQQTKQQDACIIYTRNEEVVEDENREEEEEEDEDEYDRINSPVPPPPVEDGDQMDSEEAQLGNLHSELGMPHVFKNIMGVLSGLSEEDMGNLKIRLSREEKLFKLQELFQWDILNLVDKMIEVLGHECALKQSIMGLDSIKRITEARDLENKCKRVLLRFQLKQHILRRFRVIYEGVPRPGKQQLLDTVYVQPQISRRPGNGIHLAPGDGGGSTFLDVKDLLRLTKASGEPVRTLVTTGVAGIGMSVVAARFSMDWAEDAANKDIQFVIPLSLESLWSLQKFQLPPTKKMSIMEVIEHYYQGFSDAGYLEDLNCRFLILMDSFDYYLDTLDWKNTPVLSDSHTPAHLDVLIVNLIRGKLLPSACIWILGRQAAVSTIPPELIDAVTDIHGFSDEMKDDYLSKRFQDKELSDSIVSHYKRSPALSALCQQPFVCWLAATAFERCFRYQGYGIQPPKLTPFYIHVMVIQTNRKLQRYCGQSENHLKWSQEDIHSLLNLGKLALAMVEKQVWVFSQQDLKEHRLDMKEITVFSGLCIEHHSLDTTKRKQFSFLHPTFQEFMAAVYVFAVFHMEGRVPLPEAGSWPRPKLPRIMESPRSAADLLRGAVRGTMASPHLDMVLRFLCGMMSRGSHNHMLRVRLFQAPHPALSKPEKAQQLLEREVESAPADRRANLQECLREMVQEDE
ncbi:unnamed protein product [Arctogadus glacialis]